MDRSKLAAQFEALAAEAFGPGYVSWTDVSPENVSWALEVCSTEEEVVDELVGLFDPR
jgi:hypothetical protein